MIQEYIKEYLYKDKKIIISDYEKSNLSLGVTEEDQEKWDNYKKKQHKKVLYIYNNILDRIELYKKQIIKHKNYYMYFDYNYNIYFRKRDEYIFKYKLTSYKNLLKDLDEEYNEIKIYLGVNQ